MSSHPRPDDRDGTGLEAAVDEAIAACGGDCRATIRALILANNYLENEVAELMRRYRTPMREGDSRLIQAERRTSARAAPCR